MGFRKKFERIAFGDPDHQFMRGVFPGSDVYSHEGWTVADISADQQLAFTGHEETTFVEDDDTGVQTWEFEGRTIKFRQDDGEYRAYLAPQDTQEDTVE